MFLEPRSYNLILQVVVQNLAQKKKPPMKQIISG